MQWLMHVSTCLSSYFTAYGVDELLRCFVLPFVLPCFVLPFLRPSLVPTEKAALAGVGGGSRGSGGSGGSGHSNHGRSRFGIHIHKTPSKHVCGHGAAISACGACRCMRVAGAYHK